jgi:hypothetical protein
VKRNPKLWAKALAGALAVVMALVFAAPPAVASEIAVKAPDQTPASQAVEPTPPEVERPTLAAAVAAKVETMDTAEAVAPAAMQAAGEPSEDAGSFFTSPKGIAAVVLVVAGSALVFYKRSDDRITSPVR